jgi:hypothetical protein
MVEISKIQSNLANKTGLRKLHSLIKGDMLHCAICNAKFVETFNLPKVLYCGDCLCEKCIK